MIDVMYIGIAIFILLMSLIVVFEIIPPLAQEFQNLGINLNTSIFNITSQGLQKVMSIYDYLLLGIFFGIPIAAIILAIIAGGIEFLLPLAIILLIISVLINAIFKDALLNLIQQTTYLKQYYSERPIIQYLITYFPLIIAIFGFIIIIAQFIR